MSGDNRPFRGLILPVIVVAVGGYFLVSALRRGTLNAVSLRPANWAGIALMIAGAIAAIAGGQRKLLKLAGVIVCGVGAIMVIYL